MSSDLTFGAWLKQHRKMLDLTQRELARRIGCAAVTIQKIEEGERRPSMQIAQLLADQLAISAHERDAFFQAARQGTSPTPFSNEPKPAFIPPIQLSLSTNLPAPLTPLIGRQAEMAAVRALFIRPDVRLVTLVGPPGVGKTRLSIAVAQAFLDESPNEATGLPNAKLQTPKFPDAIWFVSLAAIQDPEFVIPTIAHTLGVTESSAPTILAALQNHLRPRAHLLVLDNLEQVVEVAAQLSQLLLACPQLKVLITSRVALRIRGEYEVAIEPFALPDPTATLPSMAELRRHPALALFEARVQAFKPGFELKAENAPTVVELCRRLDGLPLAIELAAARMRQFGLESLLAHLQRPTVRSLNLLTGGARDLPPRHQTLRNAIVWSYELLDANTQQIFARLGVFVDGCTYEAIQAVVGTRQPNRGRMDHSIMPALQTLLEQSLLQQEVDETVTRFGMLETIRTFALEQLAERGEETSIYRRHADYFLSLVTTQRDTAHYSADYEPVRRDHENIRAALTWLYVHAPADALQLAIGLADFWHTQGFHAEGRQWLDNVLAANPTESLARAEGLLALGRLAHEQSDYPAAQTYLDESLQIFRSLDHPKGVARTLQQYGWLAYDTHEVGRAQTLFEESLQLFRQNGQQLYTADVMVALAHILSQAESGPVTPDAYLAESLAIYRRLEHAPGSANVLHRQALRATQNGDYPLAVSLLAEALAIYRKVNNRRDIGWTLGAVGEAAWLQRDLVAARRYLQEAWQLFDEMGDRWGLALILHHLAQVDRGDGQLHQARTRYKESLRYFQQSKNRHMIARCLAGLAAIAASENQFAAATHHLAAAQTILAALPPFLTPGDLAELAQLQEKLHRQLGAEAFDQAWVTGVSTPIETMVEQVLQRQ